MHLIMPALRDYLRHNLRAPDYDSVTLEKPVRRIEIGSDGWVASTLSAAASPGIYIWSSEGADIKGIREGSIDPQLRGTVLIIWGNTDHDQSSIDPTNSPHALLHRVKRLMRANVKLRLPWSQYSYMYPNQDIPPWIQDDREPHNANKCEGVAFALAEESRWESFDLQDNKVTERYVFNGTGLRLYFQYERIYIKTISKANNVPLDQPDHWS